MDCYLNTTHTTHVFIFIYSFTMFTTRFKLLSFLAIFGLVAFSAGGQEENTDSVVEVSLNEELSESITPDTESTLALLSIAEPDTIYPEPLPLSDVKVPPVSIYALPYSRTLSVPDWKRLWTNTAVLGGAFVGTLLVLECLPEDATTWNRAELQKDPLFHRWYKHVIKEGPEWDHDNPIFNYVLHPYAGAAYFMAARSCGFNFYQSLLYSAAVSTIGWEFGIEAFMERPSIQDIFITPLCGAVIGEGFYQAKRHIVNNGYELFGSRFLGGMACFFLDPLNEVIGLFAGNPARKVAAEHIRFTPGYKSFTLAVTF